MTYEKLSPNALKCMYAVNLIADTIALLVIAAANFFWLVPSEIRIGQIISMILAVILLLDLIVEPYFRYHRYRYRIQEDCIELCEGYLGLKRTIVPIERLHKLQTAQGPLDRIFHVEKVIVTTAGGDVKIAFLEEERAEEIADRLKNRINAIAKEQQDGRE